jgi:hypothetical protein
MPPDRLEAILEFRQKLRRRRLPKRRSEFGSLHLESTMSPRRDGGTGRRSGLKIRRGQPRGGSTPPPGTNKTKSLDRNWPLKNERPISAGGCFYGCSFLRFDPNGCLPSLWSAKNRREWHSPDSQSLAEVGSESRPRMRAPLRGRRALTPIPEPQQFISTSGECHQENKGLVCARRDPLHH